MATKERLAAMAASLCAVCSGPMVVGLVVADPDDNRLQFRTYVCARMQPLPNLQRGCR
jgi:hypothetical protein